MEKIIEYNFFVLFLLQLIVEINSQVALFRDMLIHIGQSKDSPELREKVRKIRRSCVEACKHTSQLIITQIKRYVVQLFLNFFSFYKFTLIYCFCFDWKYFYTVPLVWNNITNSNNSKKNVFFPFLPSFVHVHCFKGSTAQLLFIATMHN